MLNLIESLIIFQNAVPNDMYQDRMIRVAARSIRSCSQREWGQAGKFCVISGVILNVPTEAINETTTKKEQELQLLDLSCFDIYNQLHISC